MLFYNHILLFDRRIDKNFNMDLGDVEIVDDDHSNKVNNPNRENEIDYSDVDLKKILKDNFGNVSFLL